MANGFGFKSSYGEVVEQLSPHVCICETMCEVGDRNQQSSSASETQSFSRRQNELGKLSNAVLLSLWPEGVYRSPPTEMQHVLRTRISSSGSCAMSVQRHQATLIALRRKWTMFGFKTTTGVIPYRDQHSARRIEDRQLQYRVSWRDDLDAP